MPITEGPWKVAAAGTQWGIAKAKAARGDDDICGGSQYHDDWQANAKAIAALPEVLVAARSLVDALVADLPQTKDYLTVKAMQAALKKAGV